MKLGFIGLGKMGQAMVLHMLEEGVDVVVYNRTQQKIEELSSEYQKSKIPKQSASGQIFGVNQNQKSGELNKAYQLDQLVKLLEPPRIIWLMVEHGRAVDEIIDQLLNSGVKKGDIIIDGGNSFFKDSIRRFKSLKTKSIHFLDIGTSGGLDGARHGACLMVGGDRKIYEKVKPVLEKLAIAGGLSYFGLPGSGHFVKMVHNGVEYGMLQAIGEGFEILSKGMPATTPFTRAAHAKIDLHKVADNWNHGSVVRGWLMELLEKALSDDKGNRGDKGNWLEGISGVIGGGSTGVWTVETAKELEVDIPVIEGSLNARKKTQTKPTFSGKVVAALRREFGGHIAPKK